MGRNLEHTPPMHVSAFGAQGIQWVALDSAVGEISKTCGLVFELTKM
jgi:hypothetical protein